MLSVAAANADGTDRHGNLVPTTNLVSHLNSILVHNFLAPSIVSVCELGMTSYKKLAAGMSSLSYDSIIVQGSKGSNGSPGSDHTVMLWDASRLEQRGDYHDKDQFGRFIGQVLTPRTTDINILVVAVHLPHRKQPKPAWSRLMKYIEEMECKGEGVDGTLIVGDFNIKDQELRRRLQEDQSRRAVDLPKHMRDWQPSLRDERADARELRMASDAERVILRAKQQAEYDARLAKLRVMEERCYSDWGLVFCREEGDVTSKRGVIDNIAYNKGLLELQEKLFVTSKHGSYFQHNPVCAEFSINDS